MSRVRTSILALTIVAAFMAVTPSQANADGPLRQWLRGLWNPNSQARSNCGCATQPGQNYGYSPTAAALPQGQQVTTGYNPYNLQPGQCMKTCQQTCSRTVVNYVPYTAYRTNYKRVPVTTYKPQTSSDPCTGCTVTCMRPCTTYTYQCQRVPYTTYRPVYRQETYKVPVTTITNDCANGSCNTGCNTCATGSMIGANIPQQNFAPQPTIAQPQANYAPAITNYAPATTNYAPVQSYVNPPQPSTTTYYEEVPTGTLNPNGAGYGTSVPANQTPSLLDGINPTTTQRPFVDRFRQSASKGPARFNIQAKTAMSPIRKQWGYSPVRTASYTKPTTTRAQMAPIRNTRIQPSFSKTSNLNGWKEVN